MTTFSQQFAAAARNYDNASPAEDPAFGMDDGVASVVQDMDDMDMCELAQEVIDCRALFDWLAHNVEIPARYLPEFRAIDRQARKLSESAEAAYESLNATFGPECDE